MLREQAEAYAKAMQEAIGNKWTTYSAIRSHIHQTWVVRCYYQNGNFTKENLFATEESIIHYLIGYAGQATK